MIIAALQDEVTALIERQQGLMDQLKNESLLWQDSQTEEELTPAKLNGFQAALSSDADKVMSLESVIAVIGTMKAGKSTTINALIGENVLPHRVTAMTTLPTLIRHKPGQKEPHLILKNPQVYQRLINSVLDKINISNLQESDRVRLQEAIKTVESAGEIQSVYSGKEAIHKALFVINDTFRLAGHEKININLDDQFQYFTELSSLPTVEIEFRCLADKSEGRYEGSLALLDTPGPNEAGQSRMLKSILTEQIEKNASMVLLVMNYTQLNTEQDSEIRNQLRGIKEVFKDRSFVVVNRFDEKKKGDLGMGDTRKLASELLNESLGEDDFISEDEVFPVSSHLAFISENAKQQLSQDVSAETFVTNDDNEDFIAAAFGAIDDDELEELEKSDIEIKAKRLLKKSGYDLFLGNMLEKAYFKAGQTSLQSALGRLSNNSGKLDRFSTVVIGGLAQQLDSIDSDVKKTRNLIDSIDDVYQQVDTVKRSGIDEYRATSGKVLSEFETQVSEAIKNLFSEENFQKNKSLTKSLKESEEAQNKLSFYNDVFSWTKKKKQERRRISEEIDRLKDKLDKAKVNNGVVDFGGDEEAAKQFVKRSSGLVEDFFHNSSEALSEELKIVEDKTKYSIQTTLFDKIRSLCDGYETHMKKKGFDFNVSLFDAFSLSLMADTGVKVDIDSAVECSTIYDTKKVRKKKYRSGIVHNTLKILSLGYRDDYEWVTKKSKVERDNYKVSLSEIVALSASRLSKFCEQIDENMAREFEETLIPAVDVVFEQVIAAVKSIEEALEQVKKLKQSDADTKRRLTLLLDSIKRKNNMMHTRFETATNGLSMMSV